MYFRRENHKSISIDDMYKDINDFINRKPNYEYKIIIGTDSMVYSNCTLYITAVTLQRIGNGAIIFYVPKNEKTVYFSNRLINEVNMSVQMANEIIIPKCLEYGIYYPIEIHIDVGNKGKSKNIKNIAIGYAKGCGFNEEDIKIKPEAFGATNVADRYTKK